MRRLLSLSLILIAVICPVLAKAQTYRGAVQVAYGWARQRDGSIRDITGLVLPVTIERISARKVSLASKKRDWGNNFLNGSAFDRYILSGANDVGQLLGGNRRRVMSSSTAYMADAGSGYAIIDPAEFSDPSSLDDLSMVGAANIPWENLQFGWNTDIGRDVYVVWTGYSTWNSGAQPTEDAFSNMFVDAGVLLPASLYNFQPGTYKLTINFSAAGATSPSNNVYLAQHFRQQGNPDLFDEGFRNVYNAAAAPTIGSSENQFWFDYDPLNGIFTNGEIDVLSGEGSFSNHLRTVTVNGTTENLTALIMTPLRGRELLGSVIEVGQSDDTYASLRPNLVWQNGVPPIQFEFEGVSSGTTAINFKFKVEASTSGGGGTLRIYLHNYQTGLYDLLSTTAVGATDQNTTVEVTTNGAMYIAPANNATPRRVKSKVAFSPGGAITAGWRGKIDQVGWTITR